MSVDTERTKELVEEAYELAQRSRSLRDEVCELSKKATRLREASKKVREDLDRNAKKSSPSNQ